jgi:AraC-like DNA-binding protein
VFVKHVRGERITADANTAIFFRPGHEYRVSHPCEGGDECTTIAPGAEVLREAVTRARGAGEVPDQPSAPLSPAAFLLQARLFAGVRRAAGEFEIDELAFDLLDELLREPGRRTAETNRRSTSTLRAHRDLAEGAKAELARQGVGKVDLSAVARAVHSSPYHLSRVFRAQTGTTLSGYLLRLRVRRAVSLLAEGAADLTRIALEAGFADHSHFTNAFRREFGTTPRAFRSGVN